MIVLFSCYSILLLLRLMIYYDLRFLDVLFAKMQIDNEIVLYISELFMGVLIIYMLSSTQFGGEEEETPKEKLSKSNSQISSNTTNHDSLLESKFDVIP